MRKVARHVGQMVNAFPAGDPSLVPTVQEVLRRYAESLRPWAERTAAKMIQGVNQKDLEGWAQLTEGLSRGLRDEIASADVGATFRALMGEQVTLITSLPTEAGQRVHDLTIKGLEDSARAKEIQKEILNTGKVTESRAMLIARTEVARTSTALTEARCAKAGVTHYIWRTSGDSDVRQSHREMNGKVVPWAQPPTLSDGTTTHAGAIFNCRCYAEPVLPE